MRNLILLIAIVFSGFVSAQEFDFSNGPDTVEFGEWVTTGRLIAPSFTVTGTWSLWKVDPTETTSIRSVTFYRTRSISINGRIEQTRSASVTIVGCEDDELPYTEADVNGNVLDRVVIEEREQRQGSNPLYDQDGNLIAGATDTLPEGVNPDFPDVIVLDETWVGEAPEGVFTASAWTPWTPATAGSTIPTITQSRFRNTGLVVPAYEQTRSYTVSVVLEVDNPAPVADPADLVRTVPQSSTSTIETETQVIDNPNYISSN